MDEARRAVEAIDRASWSRILATLARRFGDLDLAEDALQAACVQALRTWPETGVPRSPEAWLTTTAKHQALDVVRRDGVLAQKLERLQPADPSEEPPPAERRALPDDRLELLFACAHPVMRPEDRVALTLRFVAGLTTVEVAHALLVPVPTMQARLTRAKQRIRTLGVPFRTPSRDDLPERVATVLRVLYLLYAEGFARSTGTTHVRGDLTAEAVELARVLHTLLPEDAEVAGLLALLLLTEARFPSRTDADGQPVPLAQQDRSRWDRKLIAEGIALAETAAASRGAGPYAIQAAIAAVHAEGATFEGTDWLQIAELYRMLEAVDSGPVVKLARAVATGRAHAPTVGLRHLERLADDPALQRFRPFHIARGLTLEELGDHPAASAAYRRALELPGNQAEDEFLSTALAGLGG
jgi:RNA polymerase sigma-70 factor (ECF subfamily)